MKNLTVNQQHILEQHQNTLLNREQNKVNPQSVSQRRNVAQHLVSKQFVDTNVIPEHEGVRDTRRHYDVNNSQSNPIYGTTDVDVKPQIRVPREPKPSAQLANFNQKSMELPAARGKKKRVDHMWSSNIFGEEADAAPEIKYRKPVAFQQPVTNGLIRMDHGLTYREDPITKKIT